MNKWSPNLYIYVLKNNVLIYIIFSAFDNRLSFGCTLSETLNQKLVFFSFISIRNVNHCGVLFFILNLGLITELLIKIKHFCSIERTLECYHEFFPIGTVLFKKEAMKPSLM
jgi:hypothetical protein